MRTASAFCSAVYSRRFLLAISDILRSRASGVSEVSREGQPPLEWNWTWVDICAEAGAVEAMASAAMAAIAKARILVFTG